MSSVVEASESSASARISQILAFIGTYAVVLYYALRGGSYDVVARQEEAIVVWWVLGLGWISGALPRFPRPRRAVVPVAALAGLCVWTALSFMWTESDFRTLAELARDLHYLGLILLVWSLFGGGTWRAAAGGMIAAATTVCALSLASRFFPGAFPANELKGVLKTNRLNYPFNYWNAVAACAAMTTAMLLPVSAHAKRWAIRALAAGAIPLCLLTTYLTYARQGALGLAVAAVVALALSRNRWTLCVNLLAAVGGGALAILAARGEPAIVNATSGAGAGHVIAMLVLGSVISGAVAALTRAARLDRLRLPRRVAIVLVACGVLLVAGAAVSVARPEINKGWNQFKTEGGPPVSTDPAARLTNLHGTRFAHWQSAWRAFKAHPVGGIGAGTFEFWSSRDGIREFVRDAHSLYFESLAEMGIIGFLLVITFLIGLLAAAGRRRRRIRDTSGIGLHVALTSAFVVWCAHAAVDWVWETTALSVIALAGIALAAVRHRPIEASGAGALRAPRWPLRLALGVIALIAVLVQIPNLATTSLMRQSEAAFRAGNVTEAASRADDAIRASPWSADAYMQRALVFESQDALTQAASDMTRAMSLEPFNWRPPLLLARIEAERGDVQGALRAYRKFKRLRVKSVFKVAPS